MDAHGGDDEIRVEGLDPPIEAPRLRGKVIARANAHELLDELSSDLAAHALNCVREFGDFHLALSGGQTPMPLYEQLMYDPRYRTIRGGARTSGWSTSAAWASRTSARTSGASRR